MDGYKDQLIVVAGAGGFIGGSLVGELLRRGCTRVRAVDVKPFDGWWQRHGGAENTRLDLMEREACRAACRGAAVVFQHASDMGGMGFIDSNKCKCMLNVLITAHMLMAARETGVKRFYFPSSACVYHPHRPRELEGVPFKETDAYPANPEDGYGWEKLYCERLCRHFREDFGLETRVARYHPIYGPHGSWDDGRERVVAAVCRKVAAAKLSGRHEIEIWGDGNQTRSFLYIDDCLDGTIRLTMSAHPDPVNMGARDVISINRLVDLVSEAAGVRLIKRHKLDAPRGLDGMISDNSAIREATGWVPSTDLREGLARTYRWIHDQYAAKHGAGAVRVTG
ncbi:MAG: NAD-dependent epimerase/dehydratase family protein [Phycisphaerae bacterium]|nr:NAD-dependent epimerase/dehydratase family protein [Phycisphaerae bacterium]